MSDANDAAQVTAASDPAAEAAAAVKAAQQAAHAAAVAELAEAHGAVSVKIETLRAALAASLEKATAELGHVADTRAFLRDVDLKADEIIAWIKRAL